MLIKCEDNCNLVDPIYSHHTLKHLINCIREDLQD